MVCVFAVAIALVTFVVTVRAVRLAAPPRGEVHSVVITDRNGVPLRERLSAGEGRARWVKLCDISPAMIAATIAAEDKRFRQHIGIDFFAIARAVVSNIKAGRIVSGGSTITQQLARMRGPAGRTLRAKMREALHALWLEIVLSKDEILEQYLNRAPYGNQLFGVESAALMYFDKPARDLSAAEAALLALVPRAPSVYNPYRSGTRVEQKRRDLIQRMYQCNSISADVRDAAVAHAPVLHRKRWAFAAPHFVEMLPAVRAGTEIRTSLDYDLERRIEGIVRSHVESLAGNNAHNAAIVVIDNATAEVLALIGSPDYDDDEHGGQVNGATSLRQPGSTLKPFLYALALESGYTAATVLPDVAMSFPTEDGDYAPKNYDGSFRGPVRIRAALANSLNVPAVYLQSQLGTSNFLVMLHELGFAHLDRDPTFYGLGLTLGNGEVTLLELAAAYATIARGGIYLPPSLVPRTVPTDGRRVFAPATAWLIADILSDDETRRMNFGEDSPLVLPFMAAAKTGTSKNFRDNWTVGFTAAYTVAVWVGNADGTPMRRVSGISGAAPLFRDAMRAVAERIPPTWIETPPTIATSRVCPLSGMLPSGQCMTGIDEHFAAGTEPHESCGMHVSYPIDMRNGLLATSTCSTSVTRSKGFVDLPPRYYDWALLHGVHLPPQMHSDLCPSVEPPRTTEPTLVQAAPSITHPRHHTRYAIDPQIPRRLQILSLAAEGLGELVWFVDGIEIARTSPPHRTAWQITRGEHLIAVAAPNGAIADRVDIVVE